MSQNQQDDLIYEDQTTDISWYDQPFPNGTASNNFDRILKLRKAFCHPLTILADGHLNKRYFSSRTKETAMNWSDIELLQLHEGIYKHGIDSIEKWHQIQSDFLPQRDFIEVRLKLSQLFGTQDLSQYEGRKFESEQQIQDEFDRNKREALQSGTWNEHCKMNIKPSLMALSERDERLLVKQEMDAWIQNVYNNPHFVYRTNAKVTVDADASKDENKHNKNEKKKSRKKKKSGKATQKNTIEHMLKKQATEKNQANQELENKDEDEQGQKEQQRMDVEEEKEKPVDVGKKTEDEGKEKEKEQQVESKEKVKRTTKKASQPKSSKKKQKMVPLIPEDSDDEEMLCVE